MADPLRLRSVNRRTLLLSLVGLALAGSAFLLAAQLCVKRDVGAAGPVVLQRARDADASAFSLLPVTAAEAAEGTRNAAVASASETEADVGDELRALAAPAGETSPVRGRVVDLQGGPVPGVRVVHDHAAELSARTNTAGEFEFPRVKLGRLLVDDEAFGTVMAGIVSDASDSCTILVAPAAVIEGRVVDLRTGSAISGARLKLAADPTELARLDLDLAGSVMRAMETRSDDQGDFRIEDGVRLSGGYLVVKADTYRSEVLSFEAMPAGSLRIALHPLGVTGNAVAGRVFDQRGNAVAGAHVSAGRGSTTTGPNGVFLLHAEEIRWDEHGRVALVAVSPGRGVARGDAARDLAPGAPPPWVELQLGPDVASLSGRLVDERGAPLAAVRVSLHAPEPFGLIEESMELFTSRTRRTASIPELLGAEFRALTDGTGAFRLIGLEAGTYRLLVVDTVTMRSHTTEPLNTRSGTHEIVLDLGRLGSVAGIVVDSAGRALPGVRVQLAPTIGGTGGPYVVSDEAGRFRLERVAVTGVSLFASSETIVPVHAPIERLGADPESLVMSVARRCAVQFHFDKRNERGTELEVRDAAGTALGLRVYAREKWRELARLPAIGRSSETLSIPDTAVEAVLVRSGEIVARQALTPSAEAVQHVRF